MAAVNVDSEELADVARSPGYRNVIAVAGARA